MTITYDIASSRPEVAALIVYTSAEIPILHNGERVGTARMNWAGELEMELLDEVHRKLATGAVRLTFVRTGVRPAEIVCGRNQRLQELVLFDTL